MGAGDLRSLLRVALRRWPMIASLLVGLCAAATHGTADGGKPVGSTMLNALADSSQSLFLLPTLDGPPHELGRLRGRVVLVHFFATWCEPCREEMASLRELQSRLEGRPFAILLDRDRAVARAWNIHMLPSTVVLDGALKPRFIAEGDVDWARPDVTKILTDLLMEVPG